MKKAYAKNVELLEVKDQPERVGREARMEGEELEVSDGYHTFDELYDHRITLFIALCKQLTHQPYDNDAKFGVWRSKRHSDGSMFDGWYVMGIGFEPGLQVTYHLPLARWEEASFAQILEVAPDFDGHTSSDVLERLKDL